MDLSPTTTTSVGPSSQPRSPLTGRFGAKPEADDTTPISFRVSLAVRQRLREFAGEKGVSLSCLMNLLVNQLLAGEVDLQDLPGPESVKQPAQQATAPNPWNTPEEKAPAEPVPDPMVDLLKAQLTGQVETTRALAALAQSLAGSTVTTPALQASVDSSDLGSAMTSLVMEFGKGIRVEEAQPLGNGSARWRVRVLSQSVSAKRVRRFLVGCLGEKTVASRFSFVGFAGNQPKAKQLPPQQPVLEASVRVLPEGADQ